MGKCSLVQVTVQRLAPLLVGFEHQEIEDSVIEIGIVENTVVLLPFLAGRETVTSLKRS